MSFDVLGSLARYHQAELRAKAELQRCVGRNHPPRVKSLRRAHVRRSPRMIVEAFRWLSNALMKTSDVH
jgi:hypothetical protein